MNKSVTRRVAAVLSMSLLCLTAAGCVYYRVDDADSGRTYYTTNWDVVHYPYTGNTKFNDRKTGKTIQLQEWEAEQISRDEFMAATQGVRSTKRRGGGWPE